MTFRRNFRIGTNFASVFTMCVASAAVAGDLDPPAGPITSTMKTLTEVEPRIAINATNTPGGADSLFKITTPGSYYLTGNIQGVADKHGIEIVASGVTLDLMGFDVVGAGGTGFFDGVSATVFPLTNIAVVNGSVRSWGDEGIDLASSSPINCCVEAVLASGNAGNGIFVGVGTTVTNCSASDNAGTGIFATAGCTVSNCTAFRNTGAGIGATGGSTVSNCTAYLNTGSGISITGAASGCTVADCTARQNTLDGIVCTSSCVIRGNTCSNNGVAAGAGIHATGADNRIEGNNCTGPSARGIDVDASGNFITRNTCSGNTTNWDVVAGNIILVVNATLAPAVTGNSGGVAPGSTDPNANFSY